MLRLPAMFILLCMCFNAAYAQDDTVQVWNKWCARKDTMLLFSTANNVIQVYGAGANASELQLKSLDYTLKIGTPEISKDTISVIAMPHAPAGKKMRLAVTNKKTKKTIKTIDFYSDEVPTPVAVIGNIKGNSASRKTLLEQTSLKVIFPHSLYSYPYRVRQYTFNIHSSKGGATIPVNGCFLTKEVLEQIKNAPAGTTATFTDIKATCPECATRTLDDVNIQILETKYISK